MITMIGEKMITPYYATHITPLL